MHKLIEYVCDELEKIEKQADQSGKLSLAEIEYADKLAHLKKNLLRSDEIMDKGYSGDMRRFPTSFRDGRSYGRGDYGRADYDRGDSSYDDRGRGPNAQRDSRGRYSTGHNYSRYVRDDYSMDTGEVIMDLRHLMDEAPDDRMRQQIQRIVTKVEQMDD